MSWRDCGWCDNEGMIWGIAIPCPFCEKGYDILWDNCDPYIFNQFAEWY